jgi:hypothetical protein
MKINNRIIKIVFFSFLLSLTPQLFADSTTAAPYEKDEFPVFLHDLRRFEIITLGSLPFVTLDTSLAYSTVRYVRHDFDSAYTPSLASSATFDSDEQIGIILTSIGISVGIGITDYIIHLVKRTSKNRKRAQNENKDVNIIPIEEDQDAVRINIPDAEFEVEE